MEKNCDPGGKKPKHLYIVYGIGAVKMQRNKLQSLLEEVTGNPSEMPEQSLGEVTDPSLSYVLNTAGDALIDLAEEMEKIIHSLRTELFDK